MSKVHGILKLSDISVNYQSSRFNRHKYHELNTTIDKCWEEKCSKNSRLYNAHKFRLHGSGNNVGKIQLELGLTSYKELCGTNLHENVEFLMEKGKQDYCDKYAYLSQTLGEKLLYSQVFMMISLIIN